MRKTLFTLFLVLFFSDLVGQENYVSKVWVADQGNGTYKNPVLYADYSDPDACRVGDDYYMTASSFNCIPGLPILHSKDLVNWTIIGHAIDKMPKNAVFGEVVSITEGMSGLRPYGIIKESFTSIMAIPI